MLKYILIILIIVYIIIYYLKQKYINPYKLIMIFGKKGSGKSTYLTKLSIKYNKLGYKVYSNTEIFNTYYLNPKDIGIIEFPENSVLLLDEIGTIWHCRDYKSFPKEVRNYFKYQRQYKHIVYMTSQSFDVDKTLRNLCDEIYLSVSIFDFISILKKIHKSITISKSEDEDKPTFLTEDYKFCSIFQWQFTFIPRYTYFFKSFNPPKLIPLQNEQKYIYYDLDTLQKLTTKKGYYDYLFNYIKTTIKTKYINNIKSFNLNSKTIYLIQEDLRNNSKY